MTDKERIEKILSALKFELEKAKYKVDCLMFEIAGVENEIRDFNNPFIESLDDHFFTPMPPSRLKRHQFMFYKKGRYND